MIGINLSRFPIVEVVKEVFLLYQMKRIPITLVHKPVSTNRASISFGDIENGYFSSMFPRTFLNISISIVGNFNILAFSVLISSVVRVAKVGLMPYKEITHISIVKIIIKEELGLCY